MKKLAGLILIAAAVAGCGKTITYSNDYSAATVINASPSSPIFNVIVDNINQTGASLVYKGSSGYLNLRPGARNIIFQSNNPVLPVNYVSLPAENFVTNTASTFVVYDTLLTPTGTLRSIRLSDTLNVPPSGYISIRYIPVAPKAVASDITFLRTTVTPNDSVTITNQNYIGPAPTATTIAALSRFIQIPAGNYTIKQKAAGTQTVLASAPLTTTVGGIYKGIFTIYSTGTAQGQPLVLGTIRHYP